MNAEKTAIKRNKASSPLKWALSQGLVRSPALDWGCGKGDDVNALQRAGITVEGWDPHWCPEVPDEDKEYKYAQCVFVLNVLDNPEARKDTLESLRSFLSPDAKILFAVRGKREVDGEPKKRGWKRQGDGWITSKGTYQHGYDPAELTQELREAGFNPKFSRRLYANIVVVAGMER